MMVLFDGGVEEALPMDVMFLLSKVQLRRIEQLFPLSHGIPKVDDRWIVSGIIYVIKEG